MTAHPTPRFEIVRKPRHAVAGATPGADYVLEPNPQPWSVRFIDSNGEEVWRTSEPYVDVRDAERAIVLLAEALGSQALLEGTKPRKDTPRPSAVAIVRVEVARRDRLDRGRRRRRHRQRGRVARLHVGPAVIYTVRPISDRTWLRPAGKRILSRFDSTWSATLKQLDRELDHLRARDVVIECDVREQDIRLDGMLRANAKAETPAVVLAFESKHGPMLHRCDTFVARWSQQGPDWQQNVRAIALTMEALRACERYGAVETGQQYAGFKALPSGRAMPSSHMTTDEAWSVLASFTPYTVEQCREREDSRHVHRVARREAHPDRHDGDRTFWDQVEQAAAVLGVS